MDFIKKHSLFIIVALALFIRFGLLFLDFSFDTHTHIIWGKDLMERGFSNFYALRSSEGYAYPFPNYPPLINFVFFLLYVVYDFIVKIEWWLNIHVPIFPSFIVQFVESRTFPAGMMKIPAVMADFGLAWVLYLFARQILPKQKNLKPLVFSMVLLNPAYFYNSSFWGQIDVIPIFFAAAAFYSLWYTKKSLLSAILFTAGLLVKPTILVFLPLYLVVFFLKKTKQEFITAAIISITLFWLSFLPFYKEGNLLSFPFYIYSEKILAAQSLNFVTNGAFNFWVLITQYVGIKDTAPFIFGITYRWWGYLLTGICFVAAFYIYLKQKNKAEVFHQAACFMAFASFLFLTKMHERYSMLMLPFLLLIAVKDRKWMKFYVVISLISFLNLFHSWRAIPVDLFKTVIEYIFTSIFLAVCNLLTFFYLFYSFIRQNIQKQKS